MKHSTLFWIAITAGVLISACSSPPPKVGPKFTGRVLYLADTHDSGIGHWALSELTAGPNSTYNTSVISSGVIEAAASPDQTQLLYATRDGIQLRDQASGQVKQVVKGESYCLAWSPDGKSFAYKQTSESRKAKLYVFDLNGKMSVVWEDSAAGDRTVNQGSARPSSDPTGCAHWVSPDKLIFDRFGPSQLRGGDVKPNSTTLAVLGAQVKLTDTEKKWSVEGICKTGSAFLRAHDSGQILIAKSLENPKTANPTSGPCSGCRFLGFAAQSCVPFFLEENSRDSSDLFYLNPMNWQRQKGAHIGQPFSLDAKMLIGSSTKFMVVGDTGSLVLVNTESGDVTTLLKADQAAGALQPVVWIEK